MAFAWFLVDEAITWFLLKLGFDRGDGRRRSRDAVAFAAGRDVVFTGFVLGDRPYCREPGGALVARPGRLRWGPFATPVWATHAIPVDRLRLLDVRPAAAAEVPRVPSDWLVAHCADGGHRVLLACHRLDMRWVVRVLAGGGVEEG